MRRPDYADSGYERLAKAVILKAVKDYALYHSAGARKVRKAWSLIERDESNRPLPGELQRHGLDAFLPSHVLQIVAVTDDPGTFLKSNTVWHEAAGVDPERFKSMDNARWRRRAWKAIGWGTNRMKI